MNWLRRKYPFTAEQTVNIFAEMGPVFAMFIANGIGGIQAGIITLIVCTVAGLILSFIVLKRPPLMPFIAGSVTVFFGLLSWYTEDPMWVQIKVTIFNALVAVCLWGGLRMGRNFFHFIFGKTFHYTPEGWYKLTRNVAIFFLITAVANEAVRLGFADAAIEVPSIVIGSFALPERVLYGIDVWILFKLFVVMPLTGIYLYWQVKVLQKYRLPEPVSVKA
ncbi:MAG: hypothetical protein RL291_1285 [Pseudomonadota bacterium]